MTKIFFKKYYDKVLKNLIFVDMFPQADKALQIVQTGLQLRSTAFDIRSVLSRHVGTVCTIAKITSVDILLL